MQSYAGKIVARPRERPVCSLAAQDRQRKDRTLAPGMPNFDDLRDVFHYPTVDAATQVYGVLGDPVAHSLSPVVHNHALRMAGQNAVYLPFRVPRGDLPGFLKAFADLGFTPPEFWFWAALCTESLAGIGLVLGLFTRFFAAAAAIEMLVITLVYWKTGFSWLNRGYEYTMLWGWICFAIALRGGGPYSLDRKLGREL